MLPNTLPAADAAPGFAPCPSSDGPRWNADALDAFLGELATEGAAALAPPRRRGRPPKARPSGDGMAPRPVVAGVQDTGRRVRTTITVDPVLLEAARVASGHRGFSQFVNELLAGALGLPLGVEVAVASLPPGATMSVAEGVVP